MKAVVLAVAVAANMMPAMKDIARSFQDKTGVQVTLTQGASGKFAAQIENGAPFDVFVSADTGYPDALAKKGLVDGKPRVYADGTLILWSLTGVDVSKGLSVLSDPSVKAIAVADPKTAPYGRQAVAALKAAGIYDAVSSKLVYGDSISQVNQFIGSKSADAGFAARSIVETPKWKGKGSWAPVDPKLYSPIEQAVVVLKASKDLKAARRLRDYLLGPAGRAALKRYGYALPPR